MKRRRPIRLKTDARKIKQEIDLLVKAYVHRRDGHKCLKCGKNKSLQAAHILPKGKYPRLRFEPVNLLTLCVGCHLFWAHKNPVGFTRWLDKNYPGRIEELEIMSAVAQKIDMQQHLLYWSK